MTKRDETPLTARKKSCEGALGNDTWKLAVKSSDSHLITSVLLVTLNSINFSREISIGNTIVLVHKKVKEKERKDVIGSACYAILRDVNEASLILLKL